MRVRIRLPELLTTDRVKRGLPTLTAYEVAKRSNGKIDQSTLYRLIRQKGRVRLFDGDLLEVLANVLDVEPGELLERTAKRKGK